MEKIKKSRFLYGFLIVLIAAVLSFSVIIGTTIAWFRKIYVIENYNGGEIDGSVIGEVSLGLYSNGALVSQSSSSTSTRVDLHYSIAASSNNTRTLNLKLRNLGTINALLRITVRMYYLDSNGNPVSLFKTNTSNPSGISAGYVYFDSSSYVTYFAGDIVIDGYMYYNQEFVPYNYRDLNGSGNTTTTPNSSNELNIISQITTSNADKSKVIYLGVTADAVAVAGNQYKKIKQSSPSSITTSNGVTVFPDSNSYIYPFGTKLPSTWSVWDYDIRYYYG